MSTHPTNEFTDPRQRFERALLQVSARLNEAGVSHRMVSDGPRGGDQLAVAATIGGDLVEIAVRRKTADHGVLALLATDQKSLAPLAAALCGSTATTRRVASLQRGFVATLEAVSRELSVRFERLAAAFPKAALQALRRVVPDAQPMIGLSATCRRAPVLTRESTLLRRVLPTRAYGASVPAGALRRAARWVPVDGAFVLPSATLRDVTTRGGPMHRGDFAAAAVAVTAADREDDASRPLEVIDGGLTACDLVDGIGCDLPLAACDIGDCGGLDCFSMSPDCVPVDCIGCG